MHSHALARPRGADRLAQRAYLCVWAVSGCDTAKLGITISINEAAGAPQSARLPVPCSRVARRAGGPLCLD